MELILNGNSEYEQTLGMSKREEISRLRKLFMELILNGESEYEETEEPTVRRSISYLINISK